MKTPASERFRESSCDYCGLTGPPEAPWLPGSSKFRSWKLKDHGDSREQAWARQSLSSFPTYETLWQDYIVPLTYRVTPQGGNFIRPNVARPYLRLADASYSVLFHLSSLQKVALELEGHARRKEDGASEGLFWFFSHVGSIKDSLRAFALAVNHFLPPRGAYKIDRQNRYAPITRCCERVNLNAYENLLQLRERYRNFLVHSGVIYVQHGLIPKAQHDGCPLWSGDHLKSFSGLAAIGRIAAAVNNHASLRACFEPVTVSLHGVIDQAHAACDEAWLIAVRRMDSVREKYQRHAIRVDGADAVLEPPDFDAARDQRNLGH